MFSFHIQISHRCLHLNQLTCYLFTRTIPTSHPQGMQQPYDKLGHSAFSINTPSQVAALLPLAPQGVLLHLHSPSGRISSPAALQEVTCPFSSRGGTCPFLSSVCLLIPKRIFFATYPFSHNYCHISKYLCVFIFFFALRSIFIIAIF